MCSCTTARPSSLCFDSLPDRDPDYDYVVSNRHAPAACWRPTGERCDRRMGVRHVLRFLPGRSLMTAAMCAERRSWRLARCWSRSEVSSERGNSEDLHHCGHCGGHWPRDFGDLFGSVD
jgi:hypothetical protein